MAYSILSYIILYNLSLPYIIQSSFHLHLLPLLLHFLLLPAYLIQGDKSISTMTRLRETYQARGIGGFYHGGTALMLRQGER